MIALILLNFLQSLPPQKSKIEDKLVTRHYSRQLIIIDFPLFIK
ncbi:hypothetical protein RINTHM_5520 [Richelia intracellularis HM01]|nr:hypothetical protein RINTHM_5520 [Richelia intracellularis HM01]